MPICAGLECRRVKPVIGFSIRRETGPVYFPLRIDINALHTPQTGRREGALAVAVDAATKIGDATWGLELDPIAPITE
jgi:hypothetical protein